MKKKKKSKAPKTSIKKKKSKSTTQNKVVIGPLHAVAYERGGEKFLHKFTSNKPTLVCSMDGKKMFVEGGKFLWTPFGVE